MTPRGFRLNNPGNIRRTSTAWQGESTLQDDPDFLRFETPAYGLRALMKILINYQAHDHLETVQDMINRWAPPVENDTGAYVRDVCMRVGVKPDDHIDIEVPDILIRMAQAIVHHENGSCPDPTLPFWYAEEVFEESARLALG